MFIGGFTVYHKMWSDRYLLFWLCVAEEFRQVGGLFFHLLNFINELTVHSHMLAIGISQSRAYIAQMYVVMIFFVFASCVVNWFVFTALPCLVELTGGDIS